MPRRHAVESSPSVEPTLSDEDLEDTIRVDRTLTTFSAASKAERQRHKPAAKKDGSDGPRVSQRGKNWNERDSILLVQAYQYSDKQKSSTDPPHTVELLIE